VEGIVFHFPLMPTIEHYLGIALPLATWFQHDINQETGEGEVSEGASKTEALTLIEVVQEAELCCS